MSALDALPLVASTVTCEPLNPRNVLYVAGVIGIHAMRAFRTTALVVRRSSRRSHRHHAASSRTGEEERAARTAGQSSVASSHRSHRHHRDGSADNEARVSRSERRSRSADESGLSTHTARSLASVRRSRSSGDAEAQARHRSRSTSHDADGKASFSARRSGRSDLAGASSAGPSDTTRTSAVSSRGSPSLPPLRPPPPAPAAVSLGGLTASRLHSNNSSFNSLNGALPPMTGKPPLSGQRSGATPRSASADEPSRRGGAATSSRTRSSSGGGGRDRETRRHQPRTHDRTTSNDSRADDDAQEQEDEEKQKQKQRSASAASSSRPHRGSSSSASASRHHTAATDSETGGVTVLPPPRVRKPWRQRMAECDVTRWAYSFTHFVRAAPAKIVHVYCGVQRQLAVLPLLRFRDEGTRTETLLGDCLPRPGERMQEVSALYTDSTVGASFLMLREMLRACASYISECLLFDNSLVVKLLRSRRASRKALGWVIRLGAHTLVDPLFLSAITPLLLIKLRDVEAGAGVAAHIRITKLGLVRGLGLGAVSVLLERVVMPSFARLVNRAVVTICESTEYVLMRRYRTWPETSSEEDDDDEDADENDDNEEAAAGRSEVTEKSGNQARGGDEERRRRRQRRERRKRREAREQAEAVAMQRAILRAIVYRVAGTLTAQCLVEHPMLVLTELLRSRAMMHVTGLLRMYDAPVSTVAPMAAVVDEDTASTFWSSLFASAHSAPVPPENVSSAMATMEHHRDATAGSDRTSTESDAVPRLVQFLRRVGVEVGQECRVLLDTMTDAAGQTSAISELLRAAQAEVEAGSRPTARESVELCVRCFLSLMPLYTAVQVTVVDRLVTFYVEVWTRLTR